MGMRARISLLRIGVGAQRGGVVGVHVARRDRIHGDAVFRPLVGEQPGQPEHAAFGRRVGRHADAALERQQRGDIDDPPPVVCPAVCWRMNCRAAACDRKNTAFRFTAITSSQSRSVNSSASARRMMPALFTRMSMRPNAAVARAITSSRRGGAQVRGDVVEPSPHPLRGRRGLVGRHDVDADDVAPGLRQGQRHSLAQPGVAAGHDGDLSAQVEHVFFSLLPALSAARRPPPGPCRRRSGFRRPCPR